MADIEITLSVDSTTEAALCIDDDVGLALDIGDTFIDGGRPYDGPYEVTPTQHTQTLATIGRKMADNVTINPIPSNYGLITWNGSVITVS